MKLYSNAFLQLAVAILCITSVHAQAVKGSGKMVKKEISIGDFTKLRNQSSANLYLVDASKTSVATIEADDNIIPLIEIANRGGELIIQNKDNTWFNTKNNIDIYLPVRKLTELQNSGSGNLIGQTTIESPSFLFTESGSGNATLSLKTQNLQLSQTGSGNATLSGQTETLTLTVRGSGNLNAARFATKTAQVKLSGSGNARIQCADVLTVQLTGSGTVTYEGSPQLTKSISGSGEVRQTGN